MIIIAIINNNNNNNNQLVTNVDSMTILKISKNTHNTPRCSLFYFIPLVLDQ